MNGQEGIYGIGILNSKYFMMRFTIPYTNTIDSILQQNGKRTKRTEGGVYNPQVHCDVLGNSVDNG